MRGAETCSVLYIRPSTESVENTPNACVQMLMLCFLEIYFGLQRINQRFKFSTSPVGLMSDWVT